MSMTAYRKPSIRAWAGACCVAFAAALAAAPAQATPLALDVTGQITQTTDAAHSVYHFSEAQLLSLPAHSISTATAWTKKSDFVGPSLADILKIVGARGQVVELHSFDDYTYAIPASDADRYGVILAYSMNGKRLQVSDFGPMFLIYPRDQYPDELSTAGATAKFVWQIKSLVIK
ncbi:oxidoreductase [Trinickia violacea]|uniref:Oxidoreductase n=2 Tax=Trinickia violacea TaxID=2571746 RepID=A0A4P8J4R2_9BURK|nr:oxidoreductase [Trinickia violacea]